MIIKDLITIWKVVFGTRTMQKALILMLIMILAALLWPKKKDSAESEMPEEFYIEFGIASYYANLFVGRPTASGEIYDHLLPTAAHQTLPLGTRVLVTCQETNNSVEVTINDRGPFIGNRIIDLSRSAFASINDLNKGLILVKVEVIQANNE